MGGQVASSYSNQVYGGALQVSDAADATFIKVHVSGCSAISSLSLAYGGGVEASGGSVEMINGSVSGCSASAYEEAVGGGVAVASGRSCEEVNGRYRHGELRPGGMGAGHGSGMVAAV